jgi:hypothetical protein
MKESFIHEFKYTKSPSNIVYFSLSVKILTILFLLSLIVGYLKDTYIFILFISSIFIILLSFIYSSYSSYSYVICEIEKYKFFEIHRDKLAINEKNYLINEISYEIQEVDKSVRIMFILWKSIIFYDKDRNKIGEFFLSIDTTENITNITLNSLTKIINDLQNNKTYDFEKLIENDSKDFQYEYQILNIGIFILISVLLIPIILVSLIFYLK